MSETQTPAAANEPAPPKPVRITIAICTYRRPALLQHTLAGIAKVLRKEEFLKSLEDAPDSAAIMGIIRHYSALR